MKKKIGKEAPKYEFSIPSREEILSALKESGKPLNSKEIAATFHMSGNDKRKAIRNRLKAMVRDGQIIRNRKGGYGLVHKMDLVSGRVIGHADGFGFLVPDSGGEDIYLSGKQMRSLLNGDRAVVRISGMDRRGRPEGKLVEVLERANDQIVGRYFKEKNISFVEPDNKRLHQDVFIPKGNEKKARHGQYVVVKLIKQPDMHTQPVGKVVEVIGDSMAQGIATEVAIRAYEIPMDWPRGVMNETRKLNPESISIPEGRKDFRKFDFVTIDGIDARDFDDAVYCRRKGNDWLLYVAIADVSYYVRPGTALDEEAYNRGTSVYFPDRVIPMLPEVLSNGLCSLNPEVDRLSMVCEMKVSESGKVTDYRFIEAVIKSSARLTYDEVAALVVNRDKAPGKKYGDLVLRLGDLYTLFKLMHDYRRAQGMLDFDTVETRILFDKKGQIRIIEPVVRNDAHRLIEEFMLAANISAAKFLIKNSKPALFRNHDLPKPEKLADLREFLKAFGLKLGGGDDATAGDYANVIDKIRDRPEANLIQTVMLRSMPLAQYSEKNMGHFGLAFEAYTHFTSPIRRYPDLVVHRAIKSLISRKSRYEYDNEKLHEFGVHCSFTERRAEEATREVVQRLKCEYMKDRLDEVYDGTITGVTGFGLFVELNDIFVEGLIHVTSLPADYYHHDPIHHTLNGERSGRNFRLANRVKVKIVRVNTDENKIDFELVKTLN